MKRQAQFFFLPLVITAVLWTPAVFAQFSLGGQSAQATEPLVDEQQVIDDVVDSFARRSQDILDNTTLGEQQMQRAKSVLSIVREAFENESRRLIDELKSDGILEAAEVERRFGDLHDQHMTRLRAAVSAIADGYEPPPQRDAYAGTFEYAGDLVAYSLFERNSGQDWLLALASIIAGLLLAWLFALVLRKIASVLQDRGVRHGAQVIQAAIGPVYVAVIAVAIRAALQWLWIYDAATQGLNAAIDVALLAALFWFVWNACQILAGAIAWLLANTYRAQIDKHVEVLIARALRIAALAAFGLIAIRGMMDSDLTGLIAGIGVLGVILTFLLRGTIENIAASFTLFGDRPFRVGHLVIYEGHWGIIEDIGFRSTKFRTLDGHLITIPNSLLVDQSIHNVSARPSIRRRFRLGLPFDTEPEKVEEAISIVEDLLHEHRGQPNGKEAHVVFEGFGEYELQLLIQYYFEPADYWAAKEFDSRINLEILRRFNEAGIAIAFPTQTLHLRDDEAADSRDEAEEPEQPRKVAQH